MTTATHPSSSGKLASPVSLESAIAAKQERKLGSFLSKPTPSEMAKVNPPQNDTIPDDGTGIVYLDPWLGPWKDEIRYRFNVAKEWIEKLNGSEGGLDNFSKVCPSELYKKEGNRKPEVILGTLGLREIWT